MSAGISSVAQTGFANASSYDTHRPSYPHEAVNVLVDRLGISGLTDAKVIDLAAGTGKFTELLAAREEGFDILAVEPHEGMRNELAKKGLKNVRVADGTSDKIPSEDGDVDALVAAQAFHWFSNEASLKEIHRALRPGGIFGMIWNIEDCDYPSHSLPKEAGLRASQHRPSNHENMLIRFPLAADNQTKSWQTKTKWESDLRTITWSFDDKHPRFRHEQWRRVFEEQAPSISLLSLPARPQFSLPLGENLTHWTVWLTPEKVWERYRTLSQIAILEGEEKERVMEKFFRIIKDGEDVERNDKGEVALHGVTLAAWTSRV
ncbi:MAG: Proteasome subunit beta type-1 [Chaenotheca gracillima]|nr:MAG: Proteasome subunit beta type-1 [Chaenotheca gracillima]